MAKRLFSVLRWPPLAALEASFFRWFPPETPRGLPCRCRYHQLPVYPHCACAGDRLRPVPSARLPRLRQGRPIASLSAGRRGSEEARKAEGSESGRMYHSGPPPSGTIRAPRGGQWPHPKEGNVGGGCSPLGHLGKGGEEERRLLSQCAGAGTKPLVLKDAGRN